MEKPGEESGRRGGRPRRAIALAALSVLLLGAVACGDDDDAAASDEDEATSGSEATDLLGPEDPASGEPVLIGMVSDGATQAFDNTDELRTAEATAEYWNTHRGGVGGRPIEIVTCETGADPAGGTNCANQMVEEQVVAVALSQSAVADAV
jgi:branched-chain amino acid transport system substrate-binding protein